jgi:N,N-dimethylformamidase
VSAEDAPRRLQRLTRFRTLPDRSSESQGEEKPSKTAIFARLLHERYSGYVRSPYRYVASEHQLRCEAGDWPREYVTGYVSPWIARPGADVDVHISTPAERFLASSVRLLGRAPDGSVESEPALSLSRPRTFDGGEQDLLTGSCVVVGPSAHLAALSSLTVSFWIFPTGMTPVPQTLVAGWDGVGAHGWRIILDMNRGVALDLAASAREHPALYLDERLQVGSWSHVLLCLDATSDEVSLSACPKNGAPRRRQARVCLDGFSSHETLTIAASDEHGRPYRAAGNGCFNGKLADVRVFDRVLTHDQSTRLSAAPDAAIDFEPVCHLDFRDAIGRASFTDRSVHRHAVRVVNAPTSAVTGPMWQASTESHYLAAQEYAALHFHSDDLDDARWEAATKIRVSADIEQTGVFAVRVETNDCVEHIPFFVTNPDAAPSPGGVAVLMPTMTYLAYGAEQEVVSTPESYVVFAGKQPSDFPFTWRDEYAVRHGVRSLYDLHCDGSSVVYASSRRPLPNLAPDYQWPLIDGPHGLGSDLMLLGWLRRAGFDASVLTDHDLNHEGASALRNCRVLLTGSHPEYWSPQMFGGLESFLKGGGRLLYLGGNGFYWVTDVLRGRDHIIEVRRGFGRSGPSTSAPGETWLTTTELEGGIWRDRGRPPQRLVGVGTAATGAGPGRPYLRADQLDECGQFAFEGVDAPEIGAGGSILNAAAAYEFDRADLGLGTPPDAIILGSATGFAEPYKPIPEESEGPADRGVNEVMRADMLLFSRPAGGCVFAIGSAAWNASLELENSGATDTARITQNVLERFRDTPDGVSPLDPAESQPQ